MINEAITADMDVAEVVMYEKCFLARIASDDGSVTTTR